MSDMLTQGDARLLRDALIQAIAVMDSRDESKDVRA